MALYSLLNKNHYLFLVGTSDNEYNHFFLNQIPEKLNATSRLVTITPDEFIISPAFPAPLLLIKEIDRYLEKWNSEELQIFFEKCYSLKKASKTTVVFFSKPSNLNFSHKHSQVRELYNESLYFIPNPNAQTQLSFFSISLSDEFKQYLIKFFEKNPTPKFIIELASGIIKKVFGKNFSSNDFEKIRGFKGLLSLARNKLEETLSSAGIQSELKHFFRPFLFIDNTNQWSLVRQTKNSIIDISNSSKDEVEIFLDEAISLGLLKEPLPEVFEIPSESIVHYWVPFKDWIRQEVNLVNKYRVLQKMALQYHNREGQLLSAAQIDEMIAWKASFPYSAAWGEKYAPETEIIWNYFDYSILIDDAHKEAETRKNRRLIRMTRAVATVIGIAFILSSVAAIYAGIERKKAETAQNIAEEERLRALRSKEEADLQRIKAETASKSESIAKIAAEKERQAALLASEIAIQEKQNALLAKNTAEKEKEKAELARKDAENAKVAAEKAREEALIAEQAEKEALVISLKNFENAEKLRLQQMANTMGLTASQLTREMKFGESIKKAVEAFQLNKDNFGFVYEPVIAKALIEANTKFNASAFTFQKPIKNIQLSENGLQLACQFIDDELIDFNLASKNSHVIATNVKSFILGKNNSLWITTKNHKILTYNFINQKIEEKKFPFSNAKLLGVIPSDGFLDNDLIILENGIFEPNGQQVILFKNDVSKAPDYKLNFNQKLFLLREGSSLLIYRASPHNSFEKIDTLFLPEEKTIMSFDLFTPYNIILIGDTNGTIYLYDLDQKALQTLGNIHDSRISFLKAVNVLDTQLIISASYDHTWKLTPIDFSSNQLGQPITFKGHSGWITSACYNQYNNELFTAGNDRVILNWQINLKNIVDKFSKN